MTLTLILILILVLAVQMTSFIWNVHNTDFYKSKEMYKCRDYILNRNVASHLLTHKVGSHSPWRPSVAPLMKACLASLPGRPNVFPSSLGPQEHE